MMKTRFKKGAKVFDIVITAVAGMFSVGMMQGRRLSQPSRAGVYINNGVKVAIK